MRARDEIKEQYAASERRAMGLTGELEEMRTQLEAAERSRKAAESELHEASDRVAELTNANSSLSTQKRKLETDIQAMHVRLRVCYVLAPPTRFLLFFITIELGRVPGDYPVPAGYYFKIWPDPGNLSRFCDSTVYIT